MFLLLPMLAACAVTEPPATTATSASEKPAISSSTAAVATSASRSAAACSYKTFGTSPKEVKAPVAADVAKTGTLTLTLDTSIGAMTITGDRAKVPCTLGAFEALAKQQYFDNTICHRLTTKGIYVLQCGDPTKSGRGGPGFRYADELTGKETYKAGTVAMANSGANTNGSQFFIVYKDSAQLPPNYTVLGTLDAAGIDAVNKVAEAGVVDGSSDGSPATEVQIKTMTAS